MSTTLQNFYKQTITKNWSATTGDFNVSTKPTVSSGIMVVSPNNSTLREIVRYSATGTNTYGDFITISNLIDRGLGGTSAQTHTIGETVRINLTAEHWQEMQDDINSIIAAGLPAGTSGDVMYNDGSNWVAKEESKTKFSTTEVFNGTSPTTFTDLDLSSVVGVKQKVVLLKFITTGGNVVVGVKTNGDADTYGTNSGYGGISSLLLTTNEAGTTIVKTDTSGVIEWKAAAQAFTVDVLAYW